MIIISNKVRSTSRYSGHSFPIPLIAKRRYGGKRVEGLWNTEEELDLKDGLKYSQRQHKA